MTTRKIVSTIKPILRKNGVLRAGLFGSYARGAQNSRSDIDILVDLGKNKSLLDLIGVEQELSKVLKKKVDLISYKSLHSRIKRNVLKEEVQIL